MRYSPAYSCRPLKRYLVLVQFNLASGERFAFKRPISLSQNSTPPRSVFATEPHSQAGDVSSLKGPDLLYRFVGASADVIFAVGHKDLRRGRTAPTNAAPPEGIINLSADNFMLSRTKSFARDK